MAEKIWGEERYRHWMGFCIGGGAKDLGNLGAGFGSASLLSALKIAYVDIDNGMFSCQLPVSFRLR